MNIMVDANVENWSPQQIALLNQIPVFDPSQEGRISIIRFISRITYVGALGEWQEDRFKEAAVVRSAYYIREVVQEISDNTNNFMDFARQMFRKFLCDAPKAV